MGKAKNANVKLPKRVAGIKIPKALRKKSGLLIDLLQTPQVQAAVASGFAAASAALAGDKVASGKAKRRLKFATEEGMDQLAALGDAVGGAVTAALGRWFSPGGEGDKAGRLDEKVKSPPDRDRASTH